MMRPVCAHTHAARRTRECPHTLADSSAALLEAHTDGEQLDLADLRLHLPSIRCIGVRVIIADPRISGYATLGDGAPREVAGSPTKVKAPRVGVKRPPEEVPKLRHASPQLVGPLSQPL